MHRYIRDLCDMYDLYDLCDMYDLCDLYDLYDLAHVAGWGAIEYASSSTRSLG